MNNIILTKRGKVDTRVAIPVNNRKFMRKRAKQKMEREGVPHMNRDVISPIQLLELKRIAALISLIIGGNTERHKSLFTWGCRGRGTPLALGARHYCVFEWRHPHHLGVVV